MRRGRDPPADLSAVLVELVAPELCHFRLISCTRVFFLSYTICKHILTFEYSEHYSPTKFRHVVGYNMPQPEAESASE